MGCDCIVLCRDTSVLILVSRSRTYHPDRAGSAHERTFILIRLAYETLSDPVKRYAYDRCARPSVIENPSVTETSNRFGPDIVGWKCASVAEFMRTGVLHSSGFYLASAGFMLLLARECGHDCDRCTIACCDAVTGPRWCGSSFHDWLTLVLSTRQGSRSSICELSASRFPLPTRTRPYHR